MRSARRSLPPRLSRKSHATRACAFGTRSIRNTAWPITRAITRPSTCRRLSTMGPRRCIASVLSRCEGARCFRWMTSGNSSCSTWKRVHGDESEYTSRRGTGTHRPTRDASVVSEALRYIADRFLPGTWLFPSRVSLDQRDLEQQLLRVAVAQRLLGESIFPRRGERSGRDQFLYCLLGDSPAAAVLVMDMEALRCYCLSLPCATEDVKWGDNLLFRVGEKMFAIASLDR